METPPAIKQIEFTPEDHAKAAQIARRLGYVQTAYTSTSELWGLFCLPENPARNPDNRPTRGGCIIKTLNLGFLFIQDVEDFHLTDITK